MHLETLQLVNFKNYNEARIDLSPKINVFVGKNGSGKTNLLDAIHYLSFTKSAFSADPFAVRHGEPFFLVKGLFKNEEIYHQVVCSFQSGKKIVRVDDVEYQKFSEHIGRYPVVMIAPDDTDLVKEGSESRRKFFDSILSQTDRKYLEALIEYNYALKQRNSLLKLFADRNSFDEVALDAYNQMLIRSGDHIFQKRRAFVGEFLPMFTAFYKLIVENEDAGLEYKSDLQKTGFAEGLKESQLRDLYLQRTNFGIHRDDFFFSLGSGDLKRLGSQGQRKSFIIALKLAQFESIQQQKNIKPILLLDDIFDKLDDFRIARLLELIHDDKLGQLFITDARPDRTRDLLKSIDAKASVFHVNAGMIEAKTGDD